jgi:hypothetical protein
MANAGEIKHIAARNWDRRIGYKNNLRAATMQFGCRFAKVRIVNAPHT